MLKACWQIKARKSGIYFNDFHSFMNMHTLYDVEATVFLPNLINLCLGDVLFKKLYLHSLFTPKRELFTLRSRNSTLRNYSWPLIIQKTGHISPYFFNKHFNFSFFADFRCGSNLCVCAEKHFHNKNHLRYAFKYVHSCVYALLENRIR